MKPDELDSTSAESETAYAKIKEYVLEKFDFKAFNALYCTD